MRGRDFEENKPEMLQMWMTSNNKEFVIRITFCSCSFFFRRSTHPKHVLCPKMGPSSSLRSSISCARPEMDPLEGKYHTAIVCPSTRWNVHLASAPWEYNRTPYT